MKMLSLTLGSLFITFLLFMMVRTWGTNESFKPFQTLYFSSEFANNEVEYIIPWEQNFLLEKEPKFILYADVYRGKNETLLVTPWMDRNKPKKTLEQTPSEARPTLKDLLAQFPKTRFVINCDENFDGIHKQLIETIQEGKATERVVLQSVYNTILISAKELSPMILFGSTPADLTRIKMFDSIWLLPAAPFKGDVLFTNLKYKNRDTINRDIVLEMKRRFKKVFVGPLATKEDIEKARLLDPDGFFVEDPMLILKNQ